MEFAEKAVALHILSFL